MPLSRPSQGSAALGLALVLLSPVVEAMTVTWGVTGVVTDGGATPFPAGTVMRATLRFDTLTPDSRSDTDALGVYLDDGMDLAFTLPGATYRSDGVSDWRVIHVSNDEIVSRDVFFVEVREGVAGAAVGVMTPRELHLFLQDADGSVFADDTLPATPPSLEVFEWALWSISFFGRVDGMSFGTTVEGSISSLFPVPVPVPAPSLSLAFALLGLWPLRGCKKERGRTRQSVPSSLGLVGARGGDPPVKNG